MKLLVTTVAGPDEPTRASLPFHMAANGALANGTQTTIAIAGDAVELLKPEVASGVRGIGVPPLRELLDACVAGGARFYI